MNILIIDADPRIQDFLSRALRAEGHRAEAVADVARASDLMRDDDFDAVLVEPLGGGFSGRRPCADLRRHHPDVAIVVVTACADMEEKIHALRSGADDYVTKPFNLDELLARMEAIARRRGRDPAPAQLRMGDLEVDAEARTVQCGRRAIDLTRKEYELLKLLVQSNTRVVSREKILNQVWGYSADPLTNVVDVYIARVRRKLADATDQVRIRTVHGVGYRVQPVGAENCLGGVRANFSV